MSTTRSLHDKLFVNQNCIIPQTLTQAASPDGIVSQNVDLKGFDSALFALVMGDIDEMGGSPVGAADIQVFLEHADDDGNGNPDTWAPCPDRCIDGQTPGVADSGVFIVGGSDADAASWGLITERRFARVTLNPVGLTNGGPVGVVVIQGHAHFEPVSNS